MLLGCVPITFLWFAEATHLAMETLAAETGHRRWPESEELTEFVVSLLAFPLLLAAFPPFMRRFFPPELTAKDHPDRSCRALILFLSPPVAAGKTGPDFGAFEGRLDEPACLEQFGKDSPWRMPFQAVAEQLSHERLEKVILIPSADGVDRLGEADQSGTHRDVPRFRELLDRLLPPGVRLPVETPAELGMAKTGQGVDFTAADQLSEVAEECYRRLAEQGYGDADILLDITGGRATPSVVGAMTAFHGARRWQYIRVGERTRVCNMTCTLAGSEALNRWGRGLPEEILPAVESYALGADRLRVALAAMLTGFHWVAAGLKGLLGAGGEWRGLALSVGAAAVFVWWFRRESRRGKLQISAAAHEAGGALVILLSELRGTPPEVKGLSQASLRHGDFRDLGRHNWRTPLEAIRLCLAEGKLDSVYVLCSAESGAHYGQFEETVRRAFPSRPPKTAEVAERADFVSAQSVLGALRGAADGPLRNHGKAVTVDVTGGTKVASLAAAATALSRGWAIQAQNLDDAGDDARTYRFRYAYSGEGG